MDDTCSLWTLSRLQFIMLTYLFMLAWLGVTAFTSLPVYMYFNLWTICRNSTLMEGANLCLDLRQFGRCISEHHLTVFSPSNCLRNPASHLLPKGWSDQSIHSLLRHCIWLWVGISDGLGVDLTSWAWDRPSDSSHFPRLSGCSLCSWSHDQLYISWGLVQKSPQKYALHYLLKQDKDTEHFLFSFMIFFIKNSSGFQSGNSHLTIFYKEFNFSNCKSK